MKQVAVAGDKSQEGAVDFWGRGEPKLSHADGDTIFKECGHAGSLQAKIEIWGKELGPAPDRLCPVCLFVFLKSHTIRCAMCGCGIIPGEAVALYHKSSGGLHLDKATFVRESVIGCLLWDCAPTGAAFAGHWTENGFKSAFASGGTILSEVARTGQTFAGNIPKLNEPIPGPVNGNSALGK